MLILILSTGLIQSLPRFFYYISLSILYSFKGSIIYSPQLKEYGILFVSVQTHWYLFYSLCYKPILFFFSSNVWLRLLQALPFNSCVPLMHVYSGLRCVCVCVCARAHVLNTFLLSVTAECPQLMLYCLLSPKIRHFP